MIRKSVVAFFTLSLIFSYLIIVYHNSANKSNINKNELILQKIAENTVNSRSALDQGQIKYILYWTKMFDRVDFYYGLGNTPFEGCKFTNCFTTADKNFLPVEKYDAVIFHGPTYSIGTHSYPKVRSPKQRYVYANLEAPANIQRQLSLQKFNSFYNWTLTYRMDSDIPNTYGYIVKNKTNYKTLTKESLLQKTRPIAWFVSNCYEVSSKRYKLAMKIDKLIPVDIYGDCGKLSCPKGDENCYIMLENKYRFYLSFENSYCREYVTEKLFKILKYNVIPIVYGRGDYKNITPPHSVINVEDFDTVEELANYLNVLINDDEKYLEYFKWKTDYFSVASFLGGLCGLCEKLNTDFTSKIYEDIFSWWTKYNETENICETENLPKIINS